MPTFTFTDHNAADDLPVSDEVNEHNRRLADQRIQGDIENLVRKANYSGPATNFLVQANAAELQERVILNEMRKHGLNLDMTLTEERYALHMRRVEGWRPIGAQRARKLRKRGEYVRYLPEYCSQAWLAPHLK